MVGFSYDYIWRLKAIWDLFTEGVYITDRDGVTLELNHAYEKITGIKRDEVIGKRIDDIVKAGLLSTSITKKVIETQSVVIERQMIIKTGKWVLLRGTPVVNEWGETSLVVTLVTDETVLREMKAEIKKKEEMINHYKNVIRDTEEKKDFVVVSKNFKKAVQLAEKVANVDTTVLIRGESGTGKEVIADCIYKNSHRVEQPYVKINCGAIPEPLLESELFGYEPGAFTGAKKSGHKGIFESANKGTVFLDEIGDMPLILQVKILRVLQERKIRRIGSSEDISVDVRIIAATNCNLEQMVKEKKFREDLYYRLNVVTVQIPPLRERKEEIPSLVNFFTEKINAKYDLNRRLGPTAIKSFLEYDWPGNIRELENKVEQLLVTSDEEEIQTVTDNFQEGVKEKQKIIREVIPLKMAVENVERQILKTAAQQYRTTYDIAKALDISQASVSRKLSKYKIDIDDSKTN